MSNEENLTTKSIFGWKGVIAACIFGLFFMTILYLAVNNEPDYMPSQQKKLQQQQQAENGTVPANESHHAH